MKVKFKNKLHFTFLILVVLCFLLGYTSHSAAAQQSCNLLCNSDFEDVQFAPAYSWALVTNGQMPCWRTAATDSSIEVWGTFMEGIPAYSGTQFIELNAFIAATTYQNFTAEPGTDITIGFAHRGRAGTDTMSVSIGPLGGPYVMLGKYGDGNTAWSYHTINYTIPAGMGNYFSLRLKAIYSAGADETYGNFLDAISITLPAPTAVTTSTNAICFNEANGMASVSASGGTSPYSYNWNTIPVQTQTMAVGLVANTYTVTVTDANGCIVNATITVAQPPLLTASITALTPISCHGDNNGSMTAIGEGGTSPYYYSWNNGQNNTNTIVDLGPGTYTITIIDANGCIAFTSDTIIEPAILTVSVIAVTDIYCNTTNSGNATVSGSGGTAAYSYVWNNGQTNSSITGLAVGAYSVIVTDSHACTATAIIQITLSIPPTVSFSVDDSIGCEPLCIHFVNTTPNTTNCTWNFGDTSPLSSANNELYCYETPGTYDVSLTVTDNHNCTSTLNKPALITVYPKPKAGFSISPNPSTENDSVSFNDLSIGASDWQWSFGDLNNSLSSQSSPQFMYPAGGLFTVQQIVSNDYGCLDTAVSYVEVQAEYELYFPNTFTPNGDGINDVFYPAGVGINENYFEFLVFDRWGSLIWQTSKWGFGWNGKVNNGNDFAQIGTYAWRIDLQNVAGVKHTYLGSVNLIR